ncbi:hypothetical protein V8J88_22825 [Massilia sp. W12]|uniref:hypothetical protein n=1 Tax=Massilia sp. W12 TaxID=3126507 RepID=UPI0030CEEE5E
MGDKYARRKLMVFAEDEATADVFTGFTDALGKGMKVHAGCQDLLELVVCRGWKDARAQALDYAGSRLFQNSVIHKKFEWYVLLWIDGDGFADRGAQIRQEFPQQVREHVFVLCTLKEVEALCNELGLGQTQGAKIGALLAQECEHATRLEDSLLWRQTQLAAPAGNNEQFLRLNTTVRPWLFP